MSVNLLNTSVEFAEAVRKLIETMGPEHSYILPMFEDEPLPEETMQAIIRLPDDMQESLILHEALHRQFHIRLNSQEKLNGQ